MNNMKRYLLHSSDVPCNLDQRQLGNREVYYDLGSHMAVKLEDNLSYGGAFAKQLEFGYPCHQVGFAECRVDLN